MLVGPPVPIKCGLAVAANSLCVVVIVTDVKLATDISGFGTGKEKSKSGL
jgi:hypothetical protein